MYRKDAKADISSRKYLEENMDIVLQLPPKEIANQQKLGKIIESNTILTDP